jgi:hypothetical protein
VVRRPTAGSGHSQVFGTHRKKVADFSDSARLCNFMLRRRRSHRPWWPVILLWLAAAIVGSYVGWYLKQH